MSMDLKERKFIECFKSIIDGSCNHCKSRSWKKENKIYAMKKKSDGKWLACSDRKCYLEQGGTLTIFKKEEPKPKVKTYRLVGKFLMEQRKGFVVTAAMDTTVTNDEMVVVLGNFTSGYSENPDWHSLEIIVKDVTAR